MKGFILGIVVGLLVGSAVATPRYGILDGVQRVIQLLEQIEVNTRVVR